MAKLRTISFDGVIVGGGGSGLRASLQLSQSGYKTAVISKVFRRVRIPSPRRAASPAPSPAKTRTTTGAGTCTTPSKAPTTIGDQDAIEYMCSEGPQAVFELEHMGMPFSRNEQGRIYQRPFGGQSKDYGKGRPGRSHVCRCRSHRPCAAPHAVPGQPEEQHRIFSTSGTRPTSSRTRMVPSSASSRSAIETGEVVYVKSKATVFATGGAGRIYASTTNALINTGDGIGMALRAGFPVQDMEMWQFHPHRHLRLRRIDHRRAAAAKAVTC